MNVGQRITIWSSVNGINIALYTSAHVFVDSSRKVSRRRPFVFPPKSCSVITTTAKRVWPKCCKRFSPTFRWPHSKCTWPQVISQWVHVYLSIENTAKLPPKNSKQQLRPASHAYVRVQICEQWRHSQRQCTVVGVACSDSVREFVDIKSLQSTGMHRTDSEFIFDLHHTESFLAEVSARQR